MVDLATYNFRSSISGTVSNERPTGHESESGNCSADELESSQWASRLLYDKGVAEYVESCPHDQEKDRFARSPSSWQGSIDPGQSVARSASQDLQQWVSKRGACS